MNAKASRLAAIVAAGLTLTLAACSGGGGSAPATSPTIAPPSGTTSTASVAVNIIIPGPGAAPSSSSSGRRPLYVSPSTNGTLLTVKNAAQAVVFSNAENTATGSPNCSGSGGSRVCTINIVVPAGSLTFTLLTYDTSPAGGAIPGTAKQLATSTLTQTITANAANTVTFLLSAIVTGPPVTTIGGTSSTYASTPADGAAHSVGIGFTAQDAAGNTITGGVPFASPIAVTLTETGGTGHAALVINGANVGASGNLARATDTLAVSYDGGGASGYTTTTNIGGTTVRISPLYIAPTSTTVTKLSDARTITATEASAPGSIAYSAFISTPGGCGSSVSTPTVSGAGASASASYNTAASAGQSSTCNVTVRDVLGTQLTQAITFTVSGPIGGGTTPTFPTGGSGSCSSAIAFTAVGQTATFSLTDPQYAGAFSTSNTAPSVASVNLSGANVTLTALAAGSTTISFGDTNGNTYACPVGVTTSSGSVQ